MMKFFPISFIRLSDRFVFRLLLSCHLLLLGFFASNALAQLTVSHGTTDPSKVALVIGNSAYPGSMALANPVHDAEDIAAALRRLNFEVILLADGNRLQMQTALQQFYTRLRSSGVALFYYAGHGVQVAGENYLVPVDSQVSSVESVVANALNIQNVLQTMEKARTPMNILILDACRDNPFLGLSSLDAAGMRGLPQATSARISDADSAIVEQSTPGLKHANEGPAGYLIAFATSPGKTTSDGKNRNGLYTQFLLQHLETPFISVEEMFKRVLNGVRDETGGRQTPWLNSAFKGDFCFADCKKLSNLVKPQTNPSVEQQDDFLPAVGFGF